MTAIPYTLTRDGEDHELEVEFTAAAFHRASRDEEAFGEGLEIEEVTHGSAPFELTPEESAQLERWLADTFEPDDIEEDEDDGDDWS